MTGRAECWVLDHEGVSMIDFAKVNVALNILWCLLIGAGLVAACIAFSKGNVPAAVAGVGYAVAAAIVWRKLS